MSGLAPCWFTLACLRGGACDGLAEGGRTVYGLALEELEDAVGLGLGLPLFLEGVIGWVLIGG